MGKFRIEGIDGESYIECNMTADEHREFMRNYQSAGPEDEIRLNFPDVNKWVSFRKVDVKSIKYAKEK